MNSRGDLDIVSSLLVAPPSSIKVEEKIKNIGSVMKKYSYSKFLVCFNTLRYFVTNIKFLKKKGNIQWY